MHQAVVLTTGVRSWPSPLLLKLLLPMLNRPSTRLKTRLACCLTSCLALGLALSACVVVPKVRRAPRVDVDLRGTEVDAASFLASAGRAIQLADQVVIGTLQAAGVSASFEQAPFVDIRQILQQHGAASIAYGDGDLATVTFESTTETDEKVAGQRLFVDVTGARTAEAFRVDSMALRLVNLRTGASQDFPLLSTPKAVDTSPQLTVTPSSHTLDVAAMAGFLAARFAWDPSRQSSALGGAISLDLEPERTIVGGVDLKVQGPTYDLVLDQLKVFSDRSTRQISRIEVAGHVDMGDSRLDLNGQLSNEDGNPLEILPRLVQKPAVTP